MKQLKIIGRGMDAESDLTLQAITAMTESECVVAVGAEIPQYWKLQKKYQLPRLIDVTSNYKNGVIDVSNYNDFVVKIECLLRRYEKIALVLAGHPRFGVTFISFLQQNSFFKQVNIEVIEGLSSFDKMINQIQMDPLEPGTVVLDANRLLLFRLPVVPELHYFIYHICSVGNPKTNFKNPSEGNQLKILKEYLKNFYSQDHVIEIRKIKTAKDEKNVCIKSKIKYLDKLTKKIDFRSTLYIPPSLPRFVDQQFLNLIQLQ